MTINYCKTDISCCKNTHVIFKKKHKALRYYTFRKQMQNPIGK